MRTAWSLILERLQIKDIGVRGKGRGNKHILPRQPRRCVRAVCEGYREERVTKDPNSVKTAVSVEGSGELAAKRNGKCGGYMERWQRGLTGNLPYWVL